MIKKKRFSLVLLPAVLLAAAVLCLLPAAGPRAAAESGAPADRMEPAVGTGQTSRPGDGVEQFPTALLDGKYYLVDTEALIAVYDMKGVALDNKNDQPYFTVKESTAAADAYFLVTTDDGYVRSNRGYVLQKNNREEEGHFYELSADGSAVYDNDSVLFRNPVREMKLGKKDPLFFLNGKIDMYVPAADKDNYWKNKKAAGAMLSVRQAWTFWKEALGRNGFDGTGRSFIMVVGNWARPDTKAEASTFAETVGDLGFFSTIWIVPESECELDMLAHEYNHAVLNSSIKSPDTEAADEFSIIEEGLCDVMGECCEAYIKGECDWIFNGYNIMADPLSAGMPAVYKGEYWVEDPEGRYYAHKNGLVLDHLGYMIATGDMEGAVNCEPLGTVKLAELIYETYPSLTPSAGLNDYAVILYDTAVKQYREKKLTFQQVRCVYEATYRAGLHLSFELPDAGLTRFLTLDGDVPAGCLYDIVRTSAARGNNNAFSGEIEVPAEKGALLCPDPTFGRNSDRYRIVLTSPDDPEETFVFHLTLRKGSAQREAVYVPLLGKKNPKLLVKETHHSSISWAQQESESWSGVLYEYNEAGLKTAMKYYGDASYAEASLGNQVIYEYDDSGRLILQKTYYRPADYPDRPASTVAYEYDGDGNPVTQIYDPDGAGGFSMKAENRYENGHLVYSCSWKRNGSKSDWSTSREYDAEGRLTRQVWMYNDYYIQHEERYSYDERGRTAVKETYETSSDDDSGWKSPGEPFAPNYVTEYSYDHDGNTYLNVFQVLRGGERRLTESTTMEYDREGLLTAKKTSEIYDEKTGTWRNQSETYYEYKLLSELFP